MPVHAVIAHGHAKPALAQEHERPEFTGRYLHVDGFPSHAGKVLWDRRMGEGATDSLVMNLVEGHRKGWYVLAVEDGRTECYCHGDLTIAERTRPEGVDEELGALSAIHAGCEWAYVIYPFSDLMVVYRVMLKGKPIGRAPMARDRKAYWEAVGVVSFRGREPDWELMEDGAVGLIHNLR